MLSALDENGRLVSLLDEIPKKQAFTCPACHSPVRLRHGQIMRPHFAHVSLETVRSETRSFCGWEPLRLRPSHLPIRFPAGIPPRRTALIGRMPPVEPY